MKKGIAGLMLSAAFGIGAIANIDFGAINMAIAEPRRAKSNKRQTRAASYSSLWKYLSKDGHSVAHGKRMAAKARNVKRHKRATKGK